MTQTIINFSKLQEIEIIYKNQVKSSERPKVSCSGEAFDYLLSVWNPNNISLREEFRILCLNRANKVLGYSVISQGGLSGTVVDPRGVFQVALKSNASSIILAHNHPSGNIKPSDNDIQLTKKLKQAGEFMELNVIDHLIITPDAYFSFADESLL